MGVTIDDARAITATLPRSYEALVRDQVRFRVGRMVYAAFYDRDTIMGFGFPREVREALVASEPDKFLTPRPSHMRYRWVCVQLDAIDVDCSSTRGACACRRRWVPPTRGDCANGRLQWRSPGRPQRNRSVSQDDAVPPEFHHSSGHILQGRCRRPALQE
jgi:hypothetical protein